MSTNLPLLYSVFGLAGTGGEGDPLCWSLAFQSLGASAGFYEDLKVAAIVSKASWSVPIPSLALR